MAWTDETEGLKVLVTRTVAQAAQRLCCRHHSGDRGEGDTVHIPLTGTRYMKSKWWTKLWQAMSRIEKRKCIDTARAVERAAMRQCKKDGGQAEALLVVMKCLNEVRALAKSNRETLPCQWLECLLIEIVTGSSCIALQEGMNAGNKSLKHICDKH